VAHPPLLSTLPLRIRLQHLSRILFRRQRIVKRMGNVYRQYSMQKQVLRKQVLSDCLLKCTPLGGFKTKEGCVGVGRSDLEICTDSIQCKNQCGSSKYSDDGLLKCTPVGGFKIFQKAVLDLPSPPPSLQNGIFVVHSYQCCS